MQVGPASKNARHIADWMRAVLTLQFACCMLQIFWFGAFIAAFWTGALVALGIYAWNQDMHITYICVWGVGCLLNGIADTLGLILPLVFDILFLSWFEIPFRALVPVSELIGAAFAWHLYLDYFHTGGGAPGGFLENDPILDPMGNLVNDVDPNNYQSLMAGLQKQGAIMQQQAQAGGVGKKFADLEKTLEQNAMQGVTQQMQGVTQQAQGYGAAFAGAAEQGMMQGIQQNMQQGMTQGMQGMQQGMQQGVQGFEGMMGQPPKTKRKAPCC